ncbi:unnamed protein product [Bursaphelenchus okinawaensis]|uniref:Peptidase_M13_N domain-containing protein n=1 Tax=Bursaphelenchus okinawaensis TaxID=465554 RepID=A0A811L7X1_9BILA|nr:unnamed protein product [Bursaphelenchus okinawaensis]CAG9118646.1 unnamed protein product [Bursaphelenchus okinawaensis]
MTFKSLFLFLLFVIIVYTSSVDQIDIKENLNQDYDQETCTKEDCTDKDTKQHLKYLKDDNGNIIEKTSPEYDAYLSYSRRLQASMNLSVNPCDDFYSFVCESAKSNKDLDIFSVLSSRAYQIVKHEMEELTHEKTI